MYVNFNPCSIQGQVIAAYGQVSPGMSGYRRRGLGCSDCQGTCGGLGQVQSFPNFYTPFESFDFTTWGWEEWAIVAVGGYAVLSFLADALRTGRKVRRSYRKVRAKSKRRSAAYQEYKAA